MKSLVYVLYALVIAYNSVSMQVPTWSDLVSANPESFYTSWYTKKDYSSILYANSVVNVRTQPKKESSRLGYLKIGDSIETTAITDNDWYEVLYNNKRGYIKSEYLSKIKSGIPIRYNDIFYYTGDVSIREIERIKTEWSRLPSRLRQLFSSDGSKIIITDENLGARFFNDKKLSILGVTSFYQGRDNCEIYISNMNDAIQAIYHEIGHYIDGKSDFLSKSKVFRKIWGRELKSLEKFHKTNPRNISNSTEYFAECCSLYFLERDNLKKYCPATYNYVIEMIGGLI